VGGVGFELSQGQPGYRFHISKYVQLWN